MSEKCFCHYNGYQVKDAVARKANEENKAAIEAEAAAARAAEKENREAVEAAEKNAEKLVADALRSEAAARTAETEAIRKEIAGITKLKDGSTTGDAELIGIRTGIDGKTYETAGDAVRGQIQQAGASAAITAAHGNGLHTEHFAPIVFDQLSSMIWYKEEEGELSDAKIILGSDLIPCPRKLCFEFSDEDARCIINFYKMVDGTPVIRWDILNATTSNGYKNMIGKTGTKGCMMDIPENTYMQVCVYRGDVRLYGWDGVPFGAAVSGTLDVPTSAGTISLLLEDGTSGFVVPGWAAAIVCKNGVFGNIACVKDGVCEETLTGVHRFVTLPNGYDYFFARFWKGYNYETREFEKETPTGDLSDYISIVTGAQIDKPVGRALKVIENARKICGIKWTPAADLKPGGMTNMYKKGVTYTGIPYGSSWVKPHFVGWHVSLHTFLNAVNDPESIMYKEYSTQVQQSPYYSLVCSSFAALVAGWRYPQLNYGYLLDPNLDCRHCNQPPIGEVWSNITEHCVIPERIEHFGDLHAVTVYEACTPMTARTTRLGNLPREKEITKIPWNNGEGKYDTYGYAVHSKQVIGVPDMEVYTYLNMDDQTVVGGSARPYRGDRSVYGTEWAKNDEGSLTDETKVLINIKSGTVLYLESSTGKESIDINGAAQIDVYDKVKDAPGIYYVYTDTDTTKETFEYVQIPATAGELAQILTDEKVMYCIKNIKAVDKLIAVEKFDPTDPEVEAVFIRCEYGAAAAKIIR